MRQHISEALGAFDTGDSRWYGWLSEQLLRYGSERDTRTLMQNFLGRPASPQALLEQIHRLKLGHSRQRVITLPVRPATLFFFRPTTSQNFPSFHHKDHSLHGMDIFCGISRHGNDVRGFPLLKRTDLT